MTTPITTPMTTPITTQERILALIKTDPTITRREMGKRLNLSIEGVKYHLQQMRDSEIIQHEGSAKAGQWRIVRGENNQENNQERILAIIKAEPTITRQEIVKKTGLTEGSVRYHLEKMRAAGIIQHEGSTKAGQWRIVK